MSSYRSGEPVHSNTARGGEDRLDMVHNNRVHSAGVRHASTQHSHVYLQVLEETAVDAFSRGFHHGDISCGGSGFDVSGGTSGTGRRKRSDADQLRMLRSRIAR